jgi:hypothetical protein
MVMEASCTELLDFSTTDILDLIVSRFCCELQDVWGIHDLYSLDARSPYPYVTTEVVSKDSEVSSWEKTVPG